MKIFLSIGSGAGIGFATASIFAKNGFKVIFSGRSKNSIESLVKQLHSQGLDAACEVLDASEAVAVKNLIERLILKYGHIDVLHYNAASMREESLDQQPLESLMTDLGVNIGGALAALKTVIPNMKERRKGVILLTGGVFANNPLPEFLSLSIGKAGIRTIALALFEDLKAQNIHLASVNVSTDVNGNPNVAKEIAKTFWKIYVSEKENWVPEIKYSDEFKKNER